MSTDSSADSDVSSVTQQNASQFVGFRLDNQDYAFRIEQIQEIVILDQVTSTPQVAEYVDGVSNLRGTIIPIINLRRLFGFADKATDAETRTIVVNVGQRTMGCTVDMVSQVMRIPDDAIQDAPDTITSGGAHYVTGFAKVDDRLLIVLDIDELLEPSKLEQVKAASMATRNTGES